MEKSFDDLIALALDRARVATALPEGKDEAAWESYQATRRALQRCASSQNWHRIAALASHPESIARSLVPDVLRYFGKVRIDETIKLLRSMLAVETEDTVIADIGLAFIDLDRPDAGRELMLPFCRHASADVRLAVIHALGFSQHPDAIAALIELSADSNDEVRNWATFLLGASDIGDSSFDDPRVREALAARLDDLHSETRAEAVVGLARRGDPRVLSTLKRELEAGAEWDHYLEAAEALAAPELIPALEALQERDLDGELERGTYKLSDALAACRAGAKHEAEREN